MEILIKNRNPNFIALILFFTFVRFLRLNLHLFQYVSYIMEKLQEWQITVDIERKPAWKKTKFPA